LEAEKIYRTRRKGRLRGDRAVGRKKRGGTLRLKKKDI